MKWRSSKPAKDKPVDSPTGESTIDKRKTKVAGTSVKKGTTNAALVKQSASNSSSKQTKKARNKSPGIAILGRNNTRSPLPSSKMPASSMPPNVLKTSGEGSTALPGSNKKIDVPTRGTILPPSLGTSSNPPGSSNQTTATAPLEPNAPGSSGAGLPALPPHWATRYIDTYNSSSVYQTFTVDKSSSEFKVIAGLLSPFRVASAEQIINPELWQSFKEKRKAMLRSKTDDLNLLEEMGFGSSVVRRSVKLSEGFPKHQRLTTKNGKYSVNEALLLHCTREQANLEKIMAEGLDDRLGRSGCFGRGIYFSDDPEKCVQFDGTWGNILIFGVLLGDCLSADDIPNVGLLEREPRKEDMQKRNLSDQSFDSITGRHPGRVQNEYVIFNRNQCYPFYIVKYQRAYMEYPEATRDIYAAVRRCTPGVAWRKLYQDIISLPSPYPLWKTWPFDAAFIFKSMASPRVSDNKDESAPAPSTSGHIQPARTNNNPNSDSGKLTRPSKKIKVDEEGSVCTSDASPFCSSTGHWEVLKCSHRVCLVCYHVIEVSRATMSGMPCTSVRCPSCQIVTGISVGDCPDGLMTVNIIPSVCDGYGSDNSIKINYVIDSGRHQLDRTAYLPNSPEGRAILDLLITTWDRRLTFKIGRSMTTGQKNVLVWNICHKTSQTGGVQRYGFPDEGYFTRVREELRAFGIE